MPHYIVVIDDNPGDTALLRHALDEQREPYHLEVLRDGEAAIAFVRDHCYNCRPEPCLIVLDLHLPRYDGAAVLRAIRAEPELAHVKVVILTSLASPQERAEILALGVDLYRNKPADWDGILELARQLVDICKGTESRIAAQRA